MSDFDIKSSTIEKGLDVVKGFLERLLGPAIDEQGLIFQDNVKLRRYKNQIRLLTKAKEIADKENIDIKKISLKAFAPLLEGAALEEDDTLQDMFANLLVNYIDSSKNLTINVFPSILSQLSTQEVNILNFMKSNNGRIRTQSWSKEKDITFQDEEIANLKRLGLIEPINSYSVYGDPMKPRIEETGPDEHYIGDFGSAFLKACSR